MTEMCVLVAPSGFKESLDAGEVAVCIEEGVLRVLPSARDLKAPMVDGGEGFTKALVEVTGGTLHDLTVTGPVSEPVESCFGFLGGEAGVAAEGSAPGAAPVPVGPRSAVLETAAAAGLWLVPRDLRDPSGTTTYGVGELIRAALDEGAGRILFGCGESGTTDGVAGVAQALGVRLLDRAGNELARGGAELARLRSIDFSGRDPRLDTVRIDVACNWHNLLCGPRGVARVFGPQKGASPEAVERLAGALENYADVIERETGVDAREMPGVGASGAWGRVCAPCSGRRCTRATRSCPSTWRSRACSKGPTWSSRRRAA